MTTTELLHVVVLLPTADQDRARMLVGLAGYAARVHTSGDRIDSWWGADCQGTHAFRDWLTCVESACRPDRVWVSWSTVTGGYYSEDPR